MVSKGDHNTIETSKIRRPWPPPMLLQIQVKEELVRFPSRKIDVYVDREIKEFKTLTIENGATLSISQEVPKLH